MNKNMLLELLKAGAQLHHSEALANNDYRPNPTVTEYLLTAAFLRAVLRHKVAVRVEAQCKRMINPMTSSATPTARKSFGKQRIDILIGDPLAPEALVELKIGVRSAAKLVGDVDKLLRTIVQLDRVKAPALGALAYEISIEGSGSCALATDFRRDHLKIASAVEVAIKSHVSAYWPSYDVDFALLDEQISEAELDEVGAIGEDGAGTFLHAAVLTRKMSAAAGV